MATLLNTLISILQTRRKDSDKQSMTRIVEKPNVVPESPALAKVTDSRETPKPRSRRPTVELKHVLAIHSSPRTSCLSHDSVASPSFLGFRNLMVIVLVVSNLRLIIENFSKYGVLICLRCHNYRAEDVRLGAILLSLLPCHLFLAYTIELAASRWAQYEVAQRKKNDDYTISESFNTWRLISFAHTVNATLCVCITSIMVYNYVFHPLIGTCCEFLAIVVWLKNISYALTNRDLRRAYLYPSPGTDAKMPELYASCPYPQNITISNLVYFWWAPTLVYQPVYPRTERIRWSFLAKRILEVAGLSCFIWVLSAQYASPLLMNALQEKASPVKLLERLMKLSTISVVIWLAVFFALFQSFLNAIAEVTRFADREFYTDWWNAPSVGVYWRTWNKPVYQFMKRHLYVPLISRGYSQFFASLLVFLFSAFFHELLVGVPTHNIIGVAFMGMVLQIPLILVTFPLEKAKSANGKVLGNTIFWVSFCLVGQPLGALLYFFAWQGKYGSGSNYQHIAV